MYGEYIDYVGITSLLLGGMNLSARRPRIDGDKLAYLRFKAFWSQRQLAKEAGVAEATISRLECARHPARLSIITKIADALGVGPEEIIEWP